MSRKRAVSYISCVLFLVMLILVRVVDVMPIGPEGTSVGFAHLNQWVANHIGIHMFWYHLSEICGYLAILTCAAFGVKGAIQLFTRKSIRKVDTYILALGVLYIVTIALYVLFEVFVINYRPVIMPEETHVEASFPSSHTMLICVVMGSAVVALKKAVEKKQLRTILQVLCIVVLALTVLGRVLSGAHWITDIFAGVLLSLALLFRYADFVDAIKEN